MRLLVVVCSLFLLFIGQVSLGVAKQSNANGVAILQYHHVGDDTPRVTSVTAEELREHFAYLKENDFNVISLLEAHQLLAAGEPLPEKAVAITFDDGWRNVYDNGLKIFEDFAFPFTVFVNPQLMDEAPHLYMSWQQLKELQAVGATIANHSNDHQHMTWRKPGESEAEWLARQRKDVLAAQAAIDEALGEQPRLFAYPYGEYTPALANMLRDEGFIAFAQHSGPWGAYTPLGEVPRFPASAQYANLKTLATKLNSLPLPVLQAQPESMLIEQTQPTVSVRLAENDDIRRDAMNCFYQGDAVQPDWDGWTFSLTLPSAAPIGRSRINCTTPSRSKPNSFYWYSHPFMRANEDGRWPD